MPTNNKSPRIDGWYFVSRCQQYDRLDMNAYKEVRHNHAPGAGIFSKRRDGVFDFGVATSTRYNRLYLRGLCSGLEIAKVISPSTGGCIRVEQNGDALQPGRNLTKQLKHLGAVIPDSDVRKPVIFPPG